MLVYLAYLFFIGIAAYTGVSKEQFVTCHAKTFENKGRTQRLQGA